MGQKNNKKKKKNSTVPGIYKGRLEVTRSGMGFVITEQMDKDILVRPNDFNTALHGDTVRVRVINNHSQNSRMQGEVTQVVERKQMEFLGWVEISKNFAFFQANTDKPMPDIYMPLEKLNGAKNKDRVIVRITEWEKNKKPQGEVIQVMDSEDENDKAMKELLSGKWIPYIFS